MSTTEATDSPNLARTERLAPKRRSVFFTVYSSIVLLFIILLFTQVSAHRDGSGPTLGGQDSNFIEQVQNQVEETAVAEQTVPSSPEFHICGDLISEEVTKNVDNQSLLSNIDLNTASLQSTSDGREACKWDHKNLPLHRTSGRIEISDVRQKSIGNCGFHAAIIALVVNEKQDELHFALQQRPDRLIARFYVPSNDSILLATLRLLLPSFLQPRKTMKAIVVNIDNKLAVNMKPSCKKSYLGAWPGQSHLENSPNQPNEIPIGFVPQLERAYAKKALDVYHTYPHQSGYKGLNRTYATRPELVLQALTGSKGDAKRRQSAGPSAEVDDVLRLCTKSQRICVVETAPPNATSWPMRPDGVINTPVGDITVDAGGSWYAFRELASNRTIHLVESHAYALEPIRPPLGQVYTYDDAEVFIHNPWCTTSRTATTCDEGGRGRQRILAKSIPYVFSGVSWVDI